MNFTSTQKMLGEIYLALKVTGTNWGQQMTLKNWGMLFYTNFDINFTFYDTKEIAHNQIGFGQLAKYFHIILPNLEILENVKHSQKLSNSS